MTEITRDQYGCYLGTTYENKIVVWFTERGKPDHAEGIRSAQDAYLETISEAGRNWAYCEFTAERLAMINKEIVETFEHAVMRYEDWATD